MHVPYASGGLLDPATTGRCDKVNVLFGGRAVDSVGTDEVDGLPREGTRIDIEFRARRDSESAAPR